MILERQRPDRLVEGAFCTVVGGVHTGKSGIARDIKTSKTGHLTLTVEQANGVRFKTLARNVVVRSDGDA